MASVVPSLWAQTTRRKQSVAPQSLGKSNEMKCRLRIEATKFLSPVETERQNELTQLSPGAPRRTKLGAGMCSNAFDLAGVAIDHGELLDPSKGFYNKNEDKVKLAIDVIIDEPKTEKFVSDPNKSNGTLSMEIEKLSEFAREIESSERKSETVTYVKGMPWKILAAIKTKNENTDNEKWLGFYLLCYASENVGNWSRKCSATLRIVTQKSDVEDFKKEFSGKRVFNNNSNDWGFIYFISFAELMDPSKGLYNKDEDKVTLAIDFTCE
ncbi:hypothetical protein niasHT_018697 [Heterodera trifolii]|uniref:MATH domain-containing protein n=1 Tax=Heterodera trifolii TaxID=157864 RepID=A0ABD2LBB6_9BILA